MLALGGFPPPSWLCNTTHHKTLSQSLLFPSKTHLYFLSDGPTHYTFCPVITHGSTKFCVPAFKSRRKGGINQLEMSGFDDVVEEAEEEEEEQEEYDDDEEEGEEEEEEGEEELIVPLRNMRKWMENKPRGFGEGKVYDTSIEDNLLDEMQHSKEAQLANINKLKNSPGNSNSKSKKDNLKQRAPEDVPSGIRVRLVNLPKKRNIHKDLQQAFKGFPGIVSINPVVSGNKKTRDPICRGFAFVDLKSEEDANRFVQVFSRQSINFGKIQKQVRCEIMNPKSSSSANEHSADGSYISPQLAVLSFGEVPGPDLENNDDASSDSWELITSNESKDEDDEFVPAQWEEVGENLGSLSLSEQSVDVSLGTRTEPAFDSVALKQQEKVRANKKKLEPKRKRTKVPKLNIPGSANRLRIKEKAVLTGVLSKYAVQAASASNEQP